MEKEIKGGAFQIARKMFESDLWLNKPATWKIIWVYILGKVSHKDTNIYTKGEGFFQWTKEIKLIGSDITLDMVYKLTQYAKLSSMISSKRSTRGVRIKVLNYNKYQTIDNYKYTHSSSDVSSKKAVRKQLESSTIDKNVKNVKNVKRESTPAYSAKSFFKGVKDLIEKIESEEAQATRLFLQKLETDYPNVQKGFIWSEIKKFYLYWTELNSTGRKERWEKQDAFQVDRRLVTWFGKIQQFKRSEINNKETKVGKL